MSDLNDRPSFDDWLAECEREWDAVIGDGKPIYPVFLFAVEHTPRLIVAAKELQRLGSQRKITPAVSWHCPYCGQELGVGWIGDDENTNALAIAHMKTCPNHPVRVVEKERDELREKLAEAEHYCSSDIAISTFRTARLIGGQAIDALDTEGQLEVIASFVKRHVGKSTREEVAQRLPLLEKAKGILMGLTPPRSVSSERTRKIIFAWPDDYWSFIEDGCPPPKRKGPRSKPNPLRQRAWSRAESTGSSWDEHSRECSYSVTLSGIVSTGYAYCDPRDFFDIGPGISRARDRAFKGLEKALSAPAEETHGSCQSNETVRIMWEWRRIETEPPVATSNGISPD